MTNHYAKLIWQAQQPYSAAFDDVYFSTDGGLEETRYVFLKHNQLANRWQAPDLGQFTIAETGFGTGLNFLCAWQLWQQTAPTEARLHFVSTEKFPLSPADLKSALDFWPELSALSAELLAQYHTICAGWHRLVFNQGRVTLTLIIGEALESLSQLEGKVDAWFLDGFAPAKNPEMWQPALFNQMARLSYQGSTFATFTSAGLVRRGLMERGFEVSKATGYGRKREMLHGIFSAKTKPQDRIEKSAIVIGGGIAGTASAYALALRGWQVTIIERHENLAMEASGNPVGILYPRLTSGDAELNHISLYGFLHTLRLLQTLGLAEDNFSPCGVLQLAFNAREQQRLAKLIQSNMPEEMMYAVDKLQASEIAGVQLNYEGVFIPNTGWVHPPAFCAALANHPNIKIIKQQQALKLIHDENGWQVFGDNLQLAKAPVVIIASANETMQFEQSAHCSLEPVRGQISLLAPSIASQQLKTVICTDGYISPLKQGEHCLGATFSVGDTQQDLRQSDHETNLEMLANISPDLQDLKVNAGRVSLRCASPDHLPLAGRLLDKQQLVAAPPRHNADPATLPWLDGLYVNTGHGAKGLITAPLCAEIIASALSNEPAPVDAKLMRALDPNRFLLREIGLKRLLTTPYCKIST